MIITRTPNPAIDIPAIPTEETVSETKIHQVENVCFDYKFVNKFHMIFKVGLLVNVSKDTRHILCVNSSVK